MVFLPSQSVRSSPGTVLAARVLPCETRAALGRVVLGTGCRAPPARPRLFAAAGRAVLLPFRSAKRVSPLPEPRARAGLSLCSRSSRAKRSGRTALREDIIHLLQARHKCPPEVKSCRGFCCSHYAVTQLAGSGSSRPPGGRLHSYFSCSNGKEGFPNLRGRRAAADFGTKPPH